jgi:DNA-binding transcriptional ArsR family regulator
METNIKLVGFGNELYQLTNVFTPDVNNLSNEQLQKICTSLSSNGIASIPFRDNQRNFIITDNNSFIASKKAISIDDWVINLSLYKKDKKLILTNPLHCGMIENLYKRALLIQISKLGNYWRIDSPRIFYNKTPLFQKIDIDAFRRYEISVLYLEEEGLGICIDVGTGFFSNMSVEEYFMNDYVPRFLELSGRQSEHKGTLLFDSPTVKSKCYFEKFEPNLVACTTPQMRIHGKNYENLYDYYKQKHPLYNINEYDKVALVSFPGLPDKKYVPANRLFLRISNDQLPREMSNLNKNNPEIRRKALSEFWHKLGDFPFGTGYSKVSKSFYVPNPLKQGIIELPDLMFGKNQILNKPASRNKINYKDNFKNRKSYLERFGCYYVPPTISHSIYFAYPIEVPDRQINYYAKELCEAIKKYTNIEVEPILIAYSSMEEAIISLRAEEESGLVIYLFDDTDPATYFNISYGLKQWKIKRATTYEMNKKFKALNNKDQEILKRALKNWNSYIEMTALDTIQQMGCLPYIFKNSLNFDIHLVIDVSEKASHFGFSLMMYKEGMKYPIIVDKIHSKPDRNETINKVILEKYFEELLKQNKDHILRNNLQSILILRDGKNCGEEYQTLNASINKLKGSGILPANFELNFVEYRKSTLKEIRIWNNTTPTTNVLEGSYFLIDNNSAIIATTGEGTLTQGTSAPLFIKAQHGDLKLILNDIFVASQLNYSSPGIAQRLTYSAKRIDDQLKERRMQEVERIK